MFSMMHGHMTLVVLVHLPKLLASAGAPPSGRNARSGIVQLMEVVGRLVLVHRIGNERRSLPGGHPSVSLYKIIFDFIVSERFLVKKVGF